MSDTETETEESGPREYDDGIPRFEGQIVFKGDYPEEYSPTPIEESDY